MSLLRHVAVLGSVILPATARDGSAPPAWRQDPIATIEGPSSDDPFGAIRGIALHADERVVVTESNPNRVSMFDGRGRSLGVVGRIGGGPAEYREPYSSAWLGDTLAVYDPGESRILYLTQGKSHLRIESTARLTGPDVRFHPVSPTKAYLQIPVSADGALAVGNTGKYDIRIQRGGSTVATITRKDFVVAPLLDAAWRLGNLDYQKHIEQYGAASCESSPVRPPHLSPILAVAAADNGDIWVTVRGKDEYAFNVFSADGRWLATAATNVSAESLAWISTQTAIHQTGRRVRWTDQICARRFASAPGHPPSPAQ